MHTDWQPPLAYPVALLDGTVYIPDFQHSMRDVSVSEVAAYIHADLRRRHLDRHAKPFASSMVSVARAYPDADIIIISTEGWENPGPLAAEPEE